LGEQIFDRRGAVKHYRNLAAEQGGVNLDASSCAGEL